MGPYVDIEQCYTVFQQLSGAVRISASRQHPAWLDAQRQLLPRSVNLRTSNGALFRGELHPVDICLCYDQSLDEMVLGSVHELVHLWPSFWQYLKLVLPGTSPVEHEIEAQARAILLDKPSRRFVVCTLLPLIVDAYDPWEKYARKAFGDQWWLQRYHSPPVQPVAKDGLIQLELF